MLMQHFPEYRASLRALFIEGETELATYTLH